MSALTAPSSRPPAHTMDNTRIPRNTEGILTDLFCSVSLSSPTLPPSLPLSRVTTTRISGNTRPRCSGPSVASLRPRGHAVLIPPQTLLARMSFARRPRCLPTHRNLRGEAACLHAIQRQPRKRSGGPHDGRNPWLARPRSAGSVRAFFKPQPRRTANPEGLWRSNSPRNWTSEVSLDSAGAARTPHSSRSLELAFLTAKSTVASFAAG